MFFLASGLPALASLAALAPASRLLERLSLHGTGALERLSFERLALHLVQRLEIVLAGVVKVLDIKRGKVDVHHPRQQHEELHNVGAHGRVLLEHDHHEVLQVARVRRHRREHVGRMQDGKVALGLERRRVVAQLVQEAAQRPHVQALVDSHAAVQVHHFGRAVLRRRLVQDIVS